MPPDKLSITQTKLILGEGVDEVRFFKSLLVHLRISDVQVIDYGGKTKLSNFLQTLSVVPGYSQLKSFLVTRDADENFAAALQCVDDGLQKAGFANPAAGSTVSLPTLHIFILPDNKSTGMLEDLCLSSVDTDQAIPCVDTYFQCVERATNRKPTPRAKARVHAWLASQTDPDKRLGEASEKGFWPWAVAAFQPLIQAIKGL